MGRVSLETPEFIQRVLLVDTDVWEYIIFPIEQEEERSEFWNRQKKKFYNEMTKLGDGHFTWQVPVAYIGPDRRSYTSHSTPELHFHYYVGKDDGYQFRIPLT